MISEHDLRRLYRSAPMPILLVGRNGLITESNPAASALLGRPLSALSGTPILRCVHEGDRERSKDHFSEALEGRLVEWPVRIVRGNGSIRGALVRVLPVAQGDRGSPLIAFLQESETIGERQDELHQIRGLVENLPGQFIAITDPSGRLTYSGGLARALWYDDEAWVGRKFGLLLSPVDENHVRYEALTGRTADGKIWEGMLWLTRADNEIVPFQIYAVPYRGTRTNTVMGTLFAGRDVALEQESREDQERAKRFSRIGELVVRIAHELDKPLAQLDRMAVQLQQVASDQDGPESRIGGLVWQIDQLLSGLRTFARGPVLSRQPVRVEDLISEAIAEQRYLLDEAGLRVSVSTAPKLPTVFLDRHQIVLVLRILLENAREALKNSDGGVIVLSAGTSGRGILIRCKDNAAISEVDWVGQGFDPFFTTKPDRLGLGLPIARGIATEHGGELWAMRSGDGWTTVTLELPGEPPPPSAAFRNAPLALGRSQSVLVVDDDSAVRALLRRFLERVGYRVSEAWSGRSALAQLNSGAPPELVITGLRMRDGTGSWLLERVSEDFPRIMNRTVIVTADPSQAKAIELVRELGCPILRKPIDFQLLLETLDEVSLR